MGSLGSLGCERGVNVRLTSTDEFLQRAAGLGIELDTRFEPPQTLTYVTSQSASRFWPTPVDLDELLVFLTGALEALDPWTSCWVYKRAAGWFSAEDEDQRGKVLQSIGIPAGSADVLSIDAGERASLLLALLTQVGFGWKVTDDVFVVPEHGRQLLWIDHAEAVFVLFRDAAAVESFVAAMAAAGFPLPSEPPNTSFAWPDWMGPKPGDWPN
jgi:hypothetical protein